MTDGGAVWTWSFPSLLFEGLILRHSILYSQSNHFAVLITDAGSIRGTSFLGKVTLGHLSGVRLHVVRPVVDLSDAWHTD